MKYKLTIIKYEANDNYEAEMAKYKEERNYLPRNQFEQEPPSRELAHRSLEVYLTDEEFKKVKQGVLTVFE